MSTVKTYSVDSGDATNLTLKTNGTTAVTVDSSQNVGIGTSSPWSQISSYGASGATTQFIGFKNADGGDIRFGKASGVDNTCLLGTFTSNRIKFYTNSVNVMDLDTNGNLGIGTTAGITTVSSGLAINNATAANYPGLEIQTAGVTRMYINANDVVSYIVSVGTSPLVTYTNGSERMRINSSGQLLVGTTSGSSGGKVSIQQNDNSNNNSYSGLDIYKGSATTSTAQVFQRFFISNGTANGSITANGASNAAFTAYSDARLKENIVNLPAQLANILALRPVEFDYKGYENGEGHQIGFIAQEMQGVYPDVVNEGENGMLTVTGWSKTEARLVAAIQEQQSIIQSLTDRVAQLEAK